jgi:spore coat polysaccharide biosynthesis protein SpsF
MKRVVVIQARMGSTRLPGKVLMDVAGRPALSRQIERLRLAKSVDEIVVATSPGAGDDPIVDLANVEDVMCFRGSEEDVLARFVGAAEKVGGEVIARVTGDCPLIDPGVVDLVIDDLTSHATDCDYCCNVLQRTYPRGLDIEVMFRDTLTRMGRLATSQLAREHVTVFARMEHPELFVMRNVSDAEDNSDLRWTLDKPSDLTMIRDIYEQLGMGDRVLPYREILAYVRAHPELSKLNEGNTTWDPSALNH